MRAAFERRHARERFEVEARDRAARLKEHERGMQRDLAQAQAKRMRTSLEAAKRIQAVWRGYCGRKIARALRERWVAASLIQRVWRGHRGRRLADDARKNLLRVVLTPFQLRELRLRCEITDREGDWLEMKLGVPNGETKGAISLSSASMGPSMPLVPS